MLKPTEVNAVERRRKRKKVKKIILWVLLSILILIVALVIAAAVAFGVLYNKGKASLSNEEIKVTAPDGVVLINDGAEVHYKGGKYNFNRNIVSILIMGVDKENLEDIGEEGYNGQADALFLLVADTSNGEVDLISISRDSMVNVDVYTRDGTYVTNRKMQLCLAYAYGKDDAASVQNVKKSLSELMYGMPINAYLTLDVAAVRLLSEAVGGVEVAEYTSDYTKKTGRKITVSGKDAEKYIRYRDVNVLDSNNTRMERQKEFIRAFAKKVVELTKQDVKTPINLYKSLDGYMYTDIGLEDVTYLAAEFIGGISDMDNYSVKGEVAPGENFAEFDVDKTALYELILEVFYTKVG